MSDSTDDPFLQPYIISSITIVFLMYIFRIVQVKYQPDNSQKQNKLTMLPLIIVCIALLVLFVNSNLEYNLGTSNDALPS